MTTRSDDHFDRDGWQYGLQFPDGRVEVWNTPEGASLMLDALEKHPRLAPVVIVRRHKFRMRWEAVLR